MMEHPRRAVLLDAINDIAGRHDRRLLPESGKRVPGVLPRWHEWHKRRSSGGGLGLELPLRRVRSSQVI